MPDQFDDQVFEYVDSVTYKEVIAEFGAMFPIHLQLAVATSQIARWQRELTEITASPEGAGNSSVCSGQGFREKRLPR